LLFEGIIPEGNYGAGTVIVWDTGRYETNSDISEQFNQGKIGFTFMQGGQNFHSKDLNIGYFGASTGASTALVAQHNVRK
jgi:ATP-dependent DNA ligase